MCQAWHKVDAQNMGYLAQLNAWWMDKILEKWNVTKSSPERDIHLKVLIFPCEDVLELYFYMFINVFAIFEVIWKKSIHIK